jgi:uncharacterized membrane protein
MSHKGHSNQRAKGRSVANHAGRAEEFSLERYEGISPHPDHIEQLREIKPEYADMVMEWSGKQLAHRHKQEDRVVSGRFTPLIINNIFALLALCILCGVGVYFLQMGHPNLGATIIGGTVVAVVGMFIMRTWNKQEPEGEK